ncbi:MAG: hypothetical protein M1814_003118 [Vezdaea aestivalis]|nr:MAG: hypothetical protein M1814_003118 [Vezdaea aestivalis]
MKQFWVKWELWEKMCFCLATAIGVVIIIGCVKLMYDRWQLRKYTKLADEKKARFAEMHQRQMEAGHLRAPIPFGVRAIESGIEVDGVWISRNTTPASKPASLNSSFQSKQSGSTSPTGDMIGSTGASTPQRPAMSQTEVRNPPSNPQSLSAGESPTSASGGSLESRRSSISRPRRDHARLTHHKKSLDRLIGSEYLQSRDSIEREQIARRYSSSNRSRHSAVALPSHSSGSSARSIEAVSYAPAPTINGGEHGFPIAHRAAARPSAVPSPPPQVRYPSMSPNQDMMAAIPRGAIDARPFLEGRVSDLDWLTANRMSHAAETGQLGQRGSVMPPPPAAAPGPRRSAIVDYSSAAMPSPPTSDRNSTGGISQSDYFTRPVVNRRHTSDYSTSPPSPPSALDPFINPADAQDFQAPMTYIPRSSFAAPNDTRAKKVTAAPQFPHRSPSRKNPTSDVIPAGLGSRSSGEATAPPSLTLRSPNEAPSVGQTHNHSPSEASAIAESHGFEPTQRLHLNKAVRKVNSGFEVLPAGTFSSRQEQAAIDGAIDEQVEKPKKLRKRSRSRRASETRKSRGSGIFEEREELT